MNEYLLPYKPAADALCEMHQIDPDTDIARPHPVIQGAVVTSKAWELRAMALIDLSQMLLALRIGSEAQAQSPKAH